MAALGTLAAALLGQVPLVEFALPIRPARRSTALLATLFALQLALGAAPVGRSTALPSLPLLLALELGRLRVRPLTPGSVWAPAGAARLGVRVSPLEVLVPAPLRSRLWLAAPLLGLPVRRLLPVRLSSAPPRLPVGRLLSALLRIGPLAARLPTLFSLALLVAASLPLVRSVPVSVVRVVGHGVGEFGRSALATVRENRTRLLGRGVEEAEAGHCKRPAVRTIGLLGAAVLP